MKIVLVAAGVAALLGACSSSQSPATASAPKAVLGTFGVDLANRDEAVKPGDDFFDYANGKWLASFQMPADKARFGAFDQLAEQSETDVRAIVDELLANPPAAGSTPAKVADLYAGWMDEAAIESRGIEPLQPYLQQINAVRDRAGLLKLMGSPEFAAPFGVEIDADPQDPTRYLVWIGQEGLGMPNRDYYLREGAAFDKYRQAYQTYVARVFELLGDGAPEQSAAQVIGLEKKIAQVHWAPEALRVPDKAIKTMSLAEFKRFAPAVDWDVVIGSMGLPELARVVAYGDTALRDGGKLVSSEPLEAWKKYLAFHIASGNATNLTKAFDDAQFEFFSKTLRGVEVQRERWKRGVALVNSLIGEGVGEIYVAKHFPPENKAKMDALVVNLIAALESRLKQLSWMDEPTRAEALKKLASFEPRIGYPEKWRDYSAMQIQQGRHFENVVNARRFEWNRQVARLNEPVDRGEWGMNPQTVNAYYSPLMNQITFPAAILQPPFFDPNADAAVNYGGIGGVIGHEIGHGFDDQGRAFDDKGVTRNWWTPETDEKFRAATDRLASQYDQYCPVPEGCINGRLTMGENIGDLGGLEMAYTAYQLSLNGQPAPVLDGITGDQRFFLAWAQVWRGTAREDFVRQQVVTDPHSPMQFRANGVVRNIDAWYSAFDVQSGDKLYLPPDQRVRIW
ncbi:MAG: M13 family metallopeptidase [Nevskiaceae bacterium]|nr:M13 family metallopeptidase [Nevskiaceae bacterium]